MKARLHIQCIAIVVFTATFALLSGCSSSVTTIYPVDNQPDDAERVTRSGYDFLVSEKKDVQVTVSLRAATPRAAQFYLSISNKSDYTITLDPSLVNMRMVSKGGSETVETAYAPEDVPNILRQQTLENQQEAIQLGSLTRSNSNTERVSSSIQPIVVQGRDGRLYGKRGFGTSMGSEDDAREATLQQLLFQREVLPPNKAVDGMVISPFRKNVQAIVIEVPVRGATHAFKYTLKTEKK